MTGKDLMNGMNFVDEKYVHQAEFETEMALKERSLFMKEQKRNKKSAWIKWGLAAACLCLVITGIVGWRVGWFKPEERTVVLSSGEVLTFREADTSEGLMKVKTGADTEAESVPIFEVESIFCSLPITDCVKYTSDDGKLKGFQGKYDGMKFFVEMPGETIVENDFKSEHKGEVNANIVKGACYLMDSDNNGEKTVVYEVEMHVDNCKVYIEGAGKEEEREKTENAVKDAVDAILASNFDFGIFEK